MKNIYSKDTISLSITLRIIHRDISKFSKINFETIKNNVLGKDYDLSIAIIGDKKSKRLNKAYRDKSYAPDVLSFPVSKTSGEIFLNPKVARQKSGSFDMTPLKYLIYLVIHGMLHLKGMDHGAKMEATEKQLLEKYFS
jgi:probable rRNA maturation factor